MSLLSVQDSGIFGQTVAGATSVRWRPGAARDDAVVGGIAGSPFALYSRLCNQPDLPQMNEILQRLARANRRGPVTSMICVWLTGILAPMGVAQADVQEANITFSADLAAGFIQIIGFDNSDECQGRHGLARITARKPRRTVPIASGAEVALHVAYNEVLSTSTSMNYAGALETKNTIRAAESIFKFTPQSGADYEVTFFVDGDRWYYQVNELGVAGRVAIKYKEMIASKEMTSGLVPRIVKDCVGNKAVLLEPS